MRIAAPSSKRWLPAASGLLLALLGAGGAAAQCCEQDPMPGCLVAHTSATASGTPSSLIREYPGVQCVMNVGLLYPPDYNVKVPDCGGLTARRDFLTGGGHDCDTISLIELNSDQQCRCACGQYRNDAEQLYCVAKEWLPDAARCAACRGCGTGDGVEASCEMQAQVICPADEYEIRCFEGNTPTFDEDQSEMNGIEPMGCDCTCYRKGECSVHGGGCTAKQIRPDHPNCTPNNSAHCILCPNAPDGPSLATCTMHPDHCADFERLGFATFEACFLECNTKLVRKVVDEVQSYDIQTLTGDWNCSATGDCVDTLDIVVGALGQSHWIPAIRWYLANYQPPLPTRCPYFDELAAAGLQVCETAPYLLPTCSLDFVVSNWCGCAPETTSHQFALQGDRHLNDHPLAVFGSHRAYQLYDMPIIEAHSRKDCGGAVSTSATSDHLGASCNIQGWSPSWCEGEGATSRGLLMYKRPNDCPARYEQFGYPRVLACDQAAASATAACTPIDSASAFVRQQTGDAEVTASAACTGGCGETDTPEPDIAAGQDRALPLLVNGEPSLVVSRVWERELGPTECDNNWPPLCPPPGWQAPVCEMGDGGGAGGGQGQGEGDAGGGSGGAVPSPAPPGGS